jgi:hypothetical protein
MMEFEEKLVKKLEFWRMTNNPAVVLLKITLITGHYLRWFMIFDG